MNLSLDKQVEKRTAISIRDLYPMLNEGELKEAEENLRRYTEIALQIYNEQHSECDGEFDKSHAPSTMKERSNFTLKT